ncbi:hypothetical protein C8R45DRAFT_942969 [Mycena sanguinolenta]|nr:hypothetical protein C8R45DRAFT_942969 [Mycena sanguinolenta]
MLEAARDARGPKTLIVGKRRIECARDTDTVMADHLTFTVTSVRQAVVAWRAVAVHSLSKFSAQGSSGKIPNLASKWHFSQVRQGLLGVDIQKFAEVKRIAASQDAPFCGPEGTKAMQNSMLGTKIQLVNVFMKIRDGNPNRKDSSWYFSSHSNAATLLPLSHVGAPPPAQSIAARFHSLLIEPLLSTDLLTRPLLGARVTPYAFPWSFQDAASGFIGVENPRHAQTHLRGVNRKHYRLFRLHLQPSAWTRSRSSYQVHSPGPDRDAGSTSTGDAPPTTKSTTACTTLAPRTTLFLRRWNDRIGNPFTRMLNACNVDLKRHGEPSLLIPLHGRIYTRYRALPLQGRSPGRSFRYMKTSAPFARPPTMAPAPRGQEDPLQ